MKFKTLFMSDDEKQCLCFRITIFDIFSPQVCTLFNMFVMYGDTFLPNPSSYDELYYELLRQVSIIVTC